MNVSELIAALSKMDKTAEVQVAWSVGNGVYRDRNRVAVRKSGTSVQVCGESRPVTAASKKAALTLVHAAKKAPAKKSAAKTPAKKVAAR